MNGYEVNCINKPDRNRRHEAITQTGRTGNGWRIKKESAITLIDSKAEAFYTVGKKTGKRAYIGVVREAGKAPYLRTYAEKAWNDNLLAQKECGPECKIIVANK